MELYQLVYFSTLCRHKHFANAAASLYITPSALTTAIKKLESELSCPLIDRKKDGFVLTAVGEKLLQTSERVLFEMDQFERQLKASTANKIVVNAGIEVAALFNDLMEEIGYFSLKHPNIEIWLKRHSSANIEVNLLSGDIDIGLMIKPEQKNEMLDYLEIEKMEYGLAIPKGHKWEKAEVIPPFWLKEPDNRIINLVDDLFWPLQNCFEQYGVRLSRASVSSKNNDYIKRLVEKQLGLAILPVDSELSDDRIVIRPFDPPVLIEFVLVTVKGKDFSKKEWKDVLDLFAGRKSKKETP